MSKEEARDAEEASDPGDRQAKMDELRERIQQAEEGDDVDVELLKTELEILRLESELEEHMEGVDDDEVDGEGEPASGSADAGSPGSEPAGQARSEEAASASEGRRPYWIGLGVFAVQIPLLLFAFSTVDSPTASGLPGHIVGAIVVALGAVGLKRLVDHARARDRAGGLAAGALLGVPAGIVLSATILPTLEDAGMFVYFGPSFNYVWGLVAVGGPVFAVTGLVGLVLRSRRGFDRAWTWFAAPVTAGLAFHTIVGGYFAIAASMMASTARQAYARNTPGLGVLAVLATIVVLALLRRRS